MTEVITALGHRWEALVGTTLESVRGVVVVRRCADVAELVSVAEAGLGQVAVVSSDLRGLELDVVSRLRRKGIGVIGLHPADDEAGERRLRQLSITTVLPVDAPAERFSEVVADHGQSDRDGLEQAVAAPDSRDGGAPGAAPLAGLPAGSVRADASGSRGDVPAGEEPAGELPGGDAPVELVGAGWRPAGSLVPGDEAADFSATGATGRPGPTGADAEQAEVSSARRPPERARVVAIWGPAGAPGRTTIATTLAAELASRGTEVLLVDADTYGGCVAQSLGLLDEAPGIAAACRAADQGTLDLPTLARLAPEVTSGLRVLTGLPRAERWPEVRAAALERVLELARALVTVVVIDCGFCLEDDEELSYDTAAPRRNEATLTSLGVADDVVAVGGADPVALQRLVRGLQQLGTVPSPEPLTVVNRVRSAAVGSHPQTRIADSLLRFAGVDAVRFVPDEPGVTDAALLSGRSVVEQAPESGVRTAVAELADALAPWTTAQPRRRERAWWRGSLRAVRRA